jgi:alkylation response protein AidB-like acyl-CoA dehydrogenase
MALVLTEEQELLRETAADFLAENSPVTHLRALRDGDDETGFSKAIWKNMAELGWTGIVFPEAVGGAGLGFAELGVVLEECGRTLAPYPFLSTVLLGGRAVLLGGSQAQQEAILPGVCSGDRLLALAFQEKAHFRPYDVETKAEIAGDGYRLTGEKIFVLDGHVADQLIVAARTAGSNGEREGITLFVVDRTSDGMTIQRTRMVDSRNAARVSLDGVAVESGAVLGEVDAGADILESVFDGAAIALSAEMLGLVKEVFERTVAYLKTREQFGARIGSFQALKHRAAEMFCEVELSTAITLDALRAADAGRDGLTRLASAAKARLSDAASLITCEALQMHGGIGMTDEEEIGLFLTRATTAELTFGDSAYHRDRFARLTSF